MASPVLPIEDSFPPREAGFTVPASRLAVLDEPSNVDDDAGSPDERADGRDLEPDRVRDRLVTAVVRGAAAGVALRGGLHLLTRIVKLLTDRRRVGAGGWREDRHALLETMRYASFLGSLAGVVVGADEALAGLWGKKRTARWRALVAGFLAGPTLLLAGPKPRHNSVAIYILFRGITLLVRCGNKVTAPAWIHALLAPTRWEHGDTGLMCVACCQILYSFIFLPRTMPRSYVNFILRHGGKPLYVWPAVRELVRKNATTSTPTSILKDVQGTGHLPFHTRVACELLHPGQSCMGHLTRILPEAYLRALPVYAPVYLVPALVVHRQKLLLEAGRIFPKVLRGTLRSSLFLATFITLTYAGACGSQTLFGTGSERIICTGVWLSGLSTLVEKKSRRMELALYCVSRAAESFANCLLEWGVKVPQWLRSMRLDIAIFSLAVAAITHCYSDDEGRHRDVFRSKYLNVLDFVFGNEGLNDGKIKHVPSNQDILESLDRNSWVRYWKKLLWGSE